MLVIASNLVLSEDEEALPDGVPLILYENVVTFSNVTSTTEEEGYPVTNLANPSTNQEWRGTADSPLQSTETIDVAINSVDLIDGVGIARHNFGSGAISISIYAVSGDSPSDPVLLVGPVIPPNDEPLLFQFTARSFETLRIVLTLDTVTPQAAVLYVGKLLVCERSFEIDKEFVVPRMGRRTNVVNGRSERGDYVGRVVTSQFIESELWWKHFTPSWYRTYFDPFIEEAQQDTPFFLAWSPENYPYEVLFGWLTDDPVPTTSPVTGRIGVSLKIGGIEE